MELELHPIQADILLVLLFRPSARFSELNTTGITSDHFNFHVGKLVELKLIRKKRDGRYTLTTSGKEFANRFDTDSVVVERQSKIAVLICCTRRRNGIVEYLHQVRLKQPYFGYLGYVSGKVRWGEEVVEAAKRELLEETGLTAEMELKGVLHNRVFSTVAELLEDKFFYVLKGTKVKGELLEKYKGGIIGG